LQSANFSSKTNAGQVVICRFSVLEDVFGVFPDHVLELLLAICALRVVVGPASSGFNHLDIQP
jgi:hypothetical protein